MLSFAQKFVAARDQLETHLPADEVRLLLYIDRAASFHGCPRELDVYPDGFLSRNLGIALERERGILDHLCAEGLIEIDRRQGGIAVRVNGDELRSILG